MHGISTINIELTSRCNKTADRGLFQKCHMCGRRELEKQNSDYEATLGDIDPMLFKNIAEQIPSGTVVQLHLNGEPTLYEDIKMASLILSLREIYVCMDTNGLLLGERAIDLNNFNSITVSVIQGDSVENYERQIKQLDIFVKFFRVRSPKLNIRALGKIPVYFEAFAERNGIDIIRRQFHAPEMSRNYQRETVKPEIGVCLDLLHHPAIDRHGNVFPCVRFNPDGENLLGNLNEKGLWNIIGGKKRKAIIDMHFAGRRNEVPLCKDCHYYGCPRG